VARAQFNRICGAPNRDCVKKYKSKTKLYHEQNNNTGSRFEFCWKTDKNLGQGIYIAHMTKLRVFWERSLEQKLNLKSKMKLKEKWLSVWGFELTSSEAQLFESLSALATTLSKRWGQRSYTTYLNISKAFTHRYDNFNAYFPTQKAIFLFQHSVDYLASFFQFHFWFSVQFLF
jgi:hypothetical protein